MTRIVRIVAYTAAGVVAIPLAGIIAIVALAAIFGGEPATPEATQVAAVQPEPQPEAAPTLADQWAETVIAARLDQTTINQFYAQMPAESQVAPTSERRGEDVLVRWTFADDSYIEARFYPADGRADMLLDYVAVEP